MDLKHASTLASSLLKNHGLFELGWRVRFDNSTRRFGQCRYRDKMISLSMALVQLNDREQVQETILHEIAHALVGPGIGHGPEWQEMCLVVGCKPIRCYNLDEVSTPKGNWCATCPSCGMTDRRLKRPKRLVGMYCKKCGPDKGKVVYRELIPKSPFA